MTDIQDYPALMPSDSIPKNFKVEIKFGNVPTVVTFPTYYVADLSHLTHTLHVIHQARQVKLKRELDLVGFVDFDRYAQYLSASVRISALNAEADEDIGQRYSDKAFVRSIEEYSAALVVSSADRVTAYTTLNLHEREQSVKQSFLTETTFDAYISGRSKRQLTAGENQAKYEMFISDGQSRGAEAPKESPHAMISRMSLMSQQFHLLPYLNNSIGYAQNASVMTSTTRDEGDGLRGVVDYPLIVDLSFAPYQAETELQVRNGVSYPAGAWPG